MMNLALCVSSIAATEVSVMILDNIIQTFSLLCSGIVLIINYAAVQVQAGKKLLSVSTADI